VGASESDPEAPSSLEAFRQTLNQLGWKEGISVRIDTVAIPIESAPMPKN
jgi:hypothetical protein